MAFDIREFSAVVENSVIRPDEPLNLPDGTRVRVSISADVSAVDPLDKPALTLREISERGLFNSGGVKFSRDELHERD